MDAQSIPVTVQVQSSGPTTKELRKRYGVHKAPMPVSTKAVAFVKDMNFDAQFQSGPNKQVTYSWLICDPATGILTRANTYNGGLGERVDYRNPASCKPIPRPNEDGTMSKEQRTTFRDYRPIPLSEVPFITVIPDPEPPKTEEPKTEPTPEAPTPTEEPKSEEAAS